MGKCLFLLIFISPLLNSKAIAAAICHYNGSVSNGLLDLQENARQIEKATQVAVAEKDPAGFCRRNMNLRFLNVNPNFSAAENFKCTEMSNDDLEKYVTQVYGTELQRLKGNDSNLGWLGSLVQVPAAQHLVLLDGEDYYPYQKEQPLSPQKIVTEMYEDLYSDKLELLAKDFSKPQKHFFDPSKIKNMEKIKDIPISTKMSLGQIKLCSDLKMSKTVQCTFALRKITSIAKPTLVPNSNDSYMPIDVWKKVFTSDKKYSEGLRLASLKLIGKLKTKSSQGSNIFDDLNQSFQAAGMSAKQAVDASYDVLALYGNGGANLGARALWFPKSMDDANACQEKSSVCRSLDLIGKAIPTLDYFNAKQGQPLYSFPKGVEAQCNTNKSYHFWMAAYLSHRLVEEGGDPQDASLAAYAAGVGYQLNRDLALKADFRRQGISAMTKSSYDPVINVIRADLAYTKAGADFGSADASGKAQNISVDKNLNKLMRSSSDSDNVGDSSGFDVYDDYQRYSRFNQLVAPNSLISSDD